LEQPLENKPESPLDQVQEAVRGVLALRKLAKDANMHTNKSQTAILKELSPEALKRVAIILAQMEEAGQ
jgi:hypothetical protein